MSTRGRGTPRKLKRDAIVEALYEIRFTTSTLYEVLSGRLADYAPWKGFKQKQLPLAIVPHELRKAASFRYQPTFQLVSPDQRLFIRIGPEVLVCNRSAPYVGWQNFRTELNQAITALFEKAEGLKIVRLGLRYVNALTHEYHGITSIADLDLKLQIANESLVDKANLNFISAAPTQPLTSTVRIATPELVVARIMPPGAAVFVDVDVSTNKGFSTSDESEVKRLLETAHDEEKKQFFRLLTDDQIDALEET